MTIPFPQPLTIHCEHTDTHGKRCNEPVEHPLWLAQGWLSNGRKWLDYCPYHAQQYEREQEQPKEASR